MSKKVYMSIFIILTLMIGFLSFYDLDYEMVQHWDEARHGVNSLEMIQSGDLIVHTYEGETDYWNLKPVLSFWVVALFFKIFGVSVTSLRLYSSVCVLIMAVICGIFVKRKYGKGSSLMFMAMFAACTPFWFAPLPEDFSSHFARCGDSDGLFILMFVLSMLFLSGTEKNVKSLYLAGFFHALAFLTKSWHGTLALIIIIAYLLITKVRKLSLKEKGVFFLCSEGPILLWMIVRTMVDGPQFVLKMLGYDLGARIIMPIEGHTGGILYYLQFIFAQPSFAVIFVLGTISVIYLIVKEKGFKLNNSRIFYILWGLLPILLFTIAGTKIWWYIYPSVIGLLCVSAVAVTKVIGSIKFNKIWYSAVAICLIGFFAFNVYSLGNLRTSEFQQFILQLDTDFDGRPAYTVHDTQTPGWWQGNVFVGSIKGINCKEGSYNEFIGSDSNPIMFLEKNYYTALKSYDNRFKNTQIIYQGDKFIAIEK